jgi:ArsR family transcriptional regulator
LTPPAVGRFHQRMLVTPTAADARLDPRAAGVLGVLADPLRWRIVTALAAEELCTTHLQDLLGAKQTLVSHHLRVLRDAGVVDTSPCGRFTYYRLRPGALDVARDALVALASAGHAAPSRRSC